jgi:2-isopropylmalate synthase
VRELIERTWIPEDVTIQVLVQTREHLIRRTFEAIRGARRAIVHIYNSTSPLQRRVTFGNASRDQIRQIAVDGATLVRELVPSAPETEVRCSTPPSRSPAPSWISPRDLRGGDGGLEPTPDDPIILNLPATVEMGHPERHADQIEWCTATCAIRDARMIVSLHTHNDRGTGVAATELGLLAGADRVEGTLFGNGERTGNLDIVTVALNLNSHGIDPDSTFPTSTKSAGRRALQPAAGAPSATPTSAIWCSPPSPAPTRTPSRRGSTPWPID